MDAAWIKVIVLTLAECVAPEGKTVCQEQETQYHFVDEVECQKVLEQLINYRDSFENVIVNRADSNCRAGTRQVQISEARVDPEFADPNAEESAKTAQKDFMRERHELRLKGLPVCDDQQLVTPCRRGEIIIESVSENETEVWKQER
jgi:hypothetical protein